MNYPADGGGGRSISILYERVTEIANQTLGQMQTQAGQDHSHFKSVKLGGGAFGSVPLAQDFHAQQDAAHDVFVKTIQGVLQDLEDFQSTLKACAHGHQQNDEAIESAMASMGTRYTHGHHYHANQQNLAAREDKRLDVAGGQQQADVHPDDGGASTSGNEGTNDATTPDTGGGYGNQ